MNKELYLQLRKAIQDKCPECRKHLSELDSLYGHLTESGKNQASLKVLDEIDTAPLKPLGENESVEPRQLGFREAIRLTFPSISSEFTAIDIAKALAKGKVLPKEKIDRTKINISLRNMSDIEQVKEGSGRIPAIYKKK